MALCTSKHEAAFIRKPPVRKHESGSRTTTFCCRFFRLSFVSKTYPSRRSFFGAFRQAYLPYFLLYQNVKER